MCDFRCNFPWGFSPIRCGVFPWPSRLVKSSHPKKQVLVDVWMCLCCGVLRPLENLTWCLPPLMAEPPEGGGWRYLGGKTSSFCLTGGFLMVPKKVSFFPAGFQVSRSQVILEGKTLLATNHQDFGEYLKMEESSPI